MASWIKCKNKRSGGGEIYINLDLAAVFWWDEADKATVIGFADASDALRVGDTPEELLQMAKNAR
jgi:hypothetical protein